MTDFRLCQFNWVFLDMYTLEDAGLIKEWHIANKNVATSGKAKLPPGFHRDDQRPHTLYRFEARIDADRPATNEILNWEPCDFQWIERSRLRSYVEIPKYDIARTIMRSINRSKGYWHQAKSRYVLWNVSYAYSDDRNLRLDLFPDSIVISYWNDRGPKLNPLPEYTLQYYPFIDTATELFRTAGSFRQSCTERRKQGLGDSKPFFLSLVYSPSRLAELTERIVLNKDTAFLHPDFSKWGRISPDDSPDMWRNGADKRIRKIRT